MSNNKGFMKKLKGRNAARVVHLVRSVGPTSMPWNDLYATSRRLAPGMMYPPLAIGSNSGQKGYDWEDCRGVRRRYLLRSPIFGFFYIREIYLRCVLRGYRLVVHIHNPSLVMLGYLLWLIYPNIKIVGNLHNDWSCFKLYQRACLRVLASLSRHFICVSKSCMLSIPGSLLKKLSRKNRVSYIRNGIDPDMLNMYPLEVPSSNNTRPKSCVDAVVVARMVEQKNCFFILKLIAATRSIDRLIWFGDGMQRMEIERQIDKLGIGARVVLCGRRPRNEVFETLSKSMIYIAASRWEGIGVANLEAAALGCWPFLSKIPPHQEIAESLDFRTYDLNNMSEWVNGIEEFLALDEFHRNDMRNKLAASTRTIYDINIAVGKYIDVYRRLGLS